MKHYTGEIVDVYDGDFIGWTTAELVEKVGELGGYERWIMKTKEGSELRRLVDFDKRNNKQNFYRPILFKRLREDVWEEGTLVINDCGETVLDKCKTIVEKIYKYKSNWF